MIQVQASIVLAHMFLRGVRVDRGRVGELERRDRAELDDLAGRLEREFPEALERDGKGAIRLTAKGRVPSLGYDRLEAMLRRVAAEIRAAGHPLEVPMSRGKRPGISRSMKEWEPYLGLHPFLGLWAGLKRLEARLALLADLDASTLHCEYHLLTRTGRTACSRPRDAELPGVNLQQMPARPGVPAPCWCRATRGTGSWPPITRPSSCGPWRRPARPATGRRGSARSSPPASTRMPTRPRRSWG